MPAPTMATGTASTSAFLYVVAFGMLFWPSPFSPLSRPFTAPSTPLPPPVSRITPPRECVCDAGWAHSDCSIPVLTVTDAEVTVVNETMVGAEIRYYAWTAPTNPTGNPYDFIFSVRVGVGKGWAGREGNGG